MEAGNQAMDGADEDTSQSMTKRDKKYKKSIPTRLRGDMRDLVLE
jgi:hypothetical protein